MTKKELDYDSSDILKQLQEKKAHPAGTAVGKFIDVPSEEKKADTPLEAEQETKAPPERKVAAQQTKPSFVRAGEYVVDEESIEVPEGYKVNPVVVEKMTRRVNLLMKPSVFNALKEYGDKHNVSFNKLANQAMSNFLKEVGAKS
ncbi:MAG: hypothetical protein LUC43_07800 [Burkholderiales bacterium]|nr:hypothetical protein [Burkholderiales bacterium]